MSLIKETLSFYKDRRTEEKNKKKLIRKNMDFNLLEQLIQKCNENPDLRIEVFIADGTRLLLKTYQKQETHNLINGDYLGVK